MVPLAEVTGHAVTQALLVGLGGGLGALARWSLSLWIPGPWGTWLVNLIGCVVLGFLMHPTAPLSSDARLLLGVGLMGGFTTYSSFSFQVLQLLQDGQPVRALTLAGATLCGCLVGSAVGWTIASRVWGVPSL